MTRPLMLLFVAIVAVLSSVPGLAVVDAVDVLRGRSETDFELCAGRSSMKCNHQPHIPALSADHFAVVISRPEDVGIVPRNDPDATLLDLPVAGESRLHLTFHLERVESSRSSTNHPSTQFRSSPMRRLLFGKKLDIVIEQVDALSKKQHRWFVARDIYVNDLVKSTDQDANAFQSFTLKWDLPVELVPPIQVDTTLSDLQREVHYGHLDARHFVIKFFVSGKLSRGKELMPVNNGDAYLEFSVARGEQ